MKLKICGMKLNTAEVSQLQPDYLGFIFYAGSKRFFDLENMPLLDENIEKVGVFVNAEIGYILSKIEQFGLKIVQLHGEESVDYCATLNEQLAPKNGKIWKVFGIKDQFDFSVLEAYEPYIDKFLFDTKGTQKGGNGYAFDWEILKGYPSKTPFILSGGIGPEKLESIMELSKTNLPIYGIDVNSKFEIEPGFKDVERLKKFKENLS